MPNDMDRPAAAGPNCRSRIHPSENWSPNPPGGLFFRLDARQVFYAIMVAMPRVGAIRFGDLEGKLSALRIECATCTRAGQYWIARLIEQRGRDGKVADLLAEVSADCPKKIARKRNDPCGVRCADLPRVL